MVQKDPRWGEQGMLQAKERKSHVNALSKLHRVAEGGPQRKWQMTVYCQYIACILLHCPYRHRASHPLPAPLLQLSSQNAHCGVNRHMHWYPYTQWERAGLERAACPEEEEHNSRRYGWSAFRCSGRTVLGEAVIPLHSAQTKEPVWDSVRI